MILKVSKRSIPSYPIFLQAWDLMSSQNTHIYQALTSSIPQNLAIQFWATESSTRKPWSAPFRISRTNIKANPCYPGVIGPCTEFLGRIINSVIETIINNAKKYSWGSTSSQKPSWLLEFTPCKASGMCNLPWIKNAAFIFFFLIHSLPFPSICINLFTLFFPYFASLNTFLFLPMFLISFCHFVLLIHF